MGPTGTGGPAVGGVYLDDHWSNSSDPTDAPDCASGPIGGPTEVNLHCIADTGLTQAQTTAITAGWRATMLQLQQRLLAAQKFSWAYFAEVAGGAPTNRKVCAAFFNSSGPSGSAPLYDRALMMGIRAVNRTQASVVNDVAAFLLVRGPYAWLGNPWQGCSVEGPTPLPPEALADYGVPLGNITASADGSSFSREWSRATVRFDCTALQGSISWK